MASRLFVIVISLTIGMSLRPLADQPGLLASVLNGQGETIDQYVVPNASFFFGGDETASEFSSEGEIRLKLEGSVIAPLRDDYVFEVKAAGQFRLVIGGDEVIRASGQGEWLASEEVRLRKGANSFVLFFEGAPGEDRFARVAWSCFDFGREPIMETHLLYSGAIDSRFALRRLGAELVRDRGCRHCHREEASVFQASNSELAPRLGDSTRKPGLAWLNAWLKDPSQWRASSRMPTFHRLSGDERASIAAFLSTSWRSETEREKKETRGDFNKGKVLFEKLNCRGCHSLGVSERLAEEPEPLWDLGRMASKMSEVSLKRFLREPGHDFTGIRMPNFKLSEIEASDLARYLISESVPPSSSEADSMVSDAMALKGKGLVESLGCLNCHEHKRLSNRFSAPSWATIRSANEKGCVASSAGSKGSLDFRFTPKEVTAVGAYLQHDGELSEERSRLEHGLMVEKQFRCQACHGQPQGFPSLKHMGEKLRPSWLRAFVEGEIEVKPRPWIEARMPGFSSYGATIMEGLTALHGLPAMDPPSREIERETASIGKTLVSNRGGFSCVSCHGIKGMAPLQALEGTGVNLALSGERLQEEYFTRWLLNPLRIDRQSKMPVYFTEGESPLLDFYEGEADSQIKALWEYIRQGQHMSLP